MRDLAFILPMAMTSLNVRLRQHFTKRSSNDKALAQEIMAALGGPRHYPRPPFKRARITIVRGGVGMLDPDGLPAAHKALIDALCVASSQHPCGQGIIEDDGPRHIELVVSQMAVAVPFTSVRVEELPDLPEAPKARRPRALRRKGAPSEARLAAAHRYYNLQK